MFTITWHNFWLSFGGSTTKTPSSPLCRPAHPCTFSASLRGLPAEHRSECIPLKNTSSQLDPSSAEVSLIFLIYIIFVIYFVCIYIQFLHMFIYVHFISLVWHTTFHHLPMGYSCQWAKHVWINPLLVNQPVAKGHPSIPLIPVVGWWNEAIFRSYHGWRSC